MQTSPETAHTCLQVYGSVTKKAKNSIFMDNISVAVPANHQCLALFRNHDTFPMLFSFQIFELVDMVNFIKLAVSRTAK